MLPCIYQFDMGGLDLDQIHAQFTPFRRLDIWKKPRHFSKLTPFNSAKAIYIQGKGIK